MTEKLASVLLELQHLRGDPIDRGHAKLMTAAEICSLFQFDHAAGYACDGKDNHPTGLTPLLIAEHRKKTATSDVPAIAKGKRLSAAHAEFRERMLAKAGNGAEESSKKKSKKDKTACCLRSRGFEKGKSRPIQSRGFAKHIVERLKEIEGDIVKMRSVNKDMGSDTRRALLDLGSTGTQE